MSAIEAVAWVTGGVLNPIASGFWLLGLMRRSEDLDEAMGALWALGFGAWTVAAALAGIWWAAAIYGLFAAVSALVWYHDRRKRRRKRAARSLGYKARALLAALVRRARESARSRPVLRPVPGGAR